MRRINLYRIILVLHDKNLLQPRPVISMTPRVPSGVIYCTSSLQIFEFVMALLRYFQATASLPTAKETALDDPIQT